MAHRVVCDEPGARRAVVVVNEKRSVDVHYGVLPAWAVNESGDIELVTVDIVLACREFKSFCAHLSSVHQ